MARYLSISPLQQPAPLGGPDDRDMVTFVFNVRAWKEPSETTVEELVAKLVAGSVGTANTNIFIGPKAQWPSGDGPYLMLTENAGPRPQRIQNQAQPAYVFPHVQVMAKALSYDAAKGMAWNAYGVLASVVNAVLTP